jgi:hypothetical protein
MTRQHTRSILSRWLAMLVVALGVLLTTHELRGQADRNVMPAQPLPVVFTTVPVFVDSGDAALAAYQFELTEANGRMKVVGIENGEHAAFAEAPYYDAKALATQQADRVVVAAYSLNKQDNLPAGQTRVATVQVMLTGPGEPQYQLKLIAAGDVQGKPIANATISMTRNAAD